jgi:hypothetical protein
MRDKKLSNESTSNVLLKLKKTATEIEGYAENSLSRAHVFEWHKKFSEGTEDV